MKMNKQKLAAAFLATFSIALGSTNVFADNHGITYSKTGAQQLGASNNVQENVALINGLTALIQSSANSTQTTFSNPGSWLDGYIKDTVADRTECKPIKYFKVSSGSSIGPSNNFSFSISNNDYRADVRINDVSIEASSAFGTQSTAVGIVPDTAWFYGGWPIYSEGSCNNRESTVSPITVDGTKLFANLHITMYRKGDTTPLSSNGLYLGLSDIDAAQSYKILNNDSALSPSNMYTKSIADLQEPGNPLKNWFVPASASGGPYIFSEYNPNAADTESDPKIVRSTNAANVFVKLGEQTQANGLDLVFGFADNAASGIAYYAKQYTVRYASDDNGKITDKTSEQVISGNNPTGSVQTPNEGYAFTRWTADTNVTLKDGTTITKGDPITGEEIKQVVVNSDITFTAYHAKQYVVNYRSDENGEIVGITDETVEENNNPSGSDQSSKDGYILSHWIADVDVTLEDGTIIKAGDPITTEQIEQVVVNQDITFTAIHIPKVTTPDTGTFTKGIDAAQIATISIFSIIACGLAIKFLPRVLSKKVKFDK